MKVKGQKSFGCAATSGNILYPIGGKIMEHELIAALRAGDESALYKISNAFSAYVCTVIRNFSGGRLSAQDTEELCSDVFYNLWLHRERLAEDIGLKPYLSVCAKNAAKNRLRSLKISLESADEEPEIASDIDIERAAELNAMMRCLDTALSELPDEDRGIFLRFYFYGEKTSAIAKSAGLNENTVRSKLSRTRIKLKNYLTERGFDHV